MAKRETAEQIRRFGPLTGLVIAAVLAFLVLPSTLTLPNPSPTSQEEVAPVPPTTTKLAPTVSNFTSLAAGTSGNGLGTGSGTAGPGAPGAIPPPPKLPPGLGNVPPSTYQCVAGRQTEDPLSPTCVPFYQGANGGATYQGVNAKEVRIILYFEPYGYIGTSQAPRLRRTTRSSTPIWRPSPTSIRRSPRRAAGRSSSVSATPPTTGT